MTVSEAFRTTLDALIRARGWKNVDLIRLSGLSSATITKLKNGERGASFEVLEQLRVAFGVAPADLFEPDAALAQIGLVRQGATALPGSGSSLSRDVDVSSALPPRRRSVDDMQHHDQELLSALLTYWDAISPEQRLELVGHGHRMKTAASAPQADFRAGYRP